MEYIISIRSNIYTAQPGEKMKKTLVEIRVRYAETDQMGVAHHGSYFTWMEAARTELMREEGLPYRKIEEYGYYLPVREAYCRYKSSLQYDDVVWVEVELVELKGASLKLSYRMLRKEDGKVAAEGYTIHAFTNTEGKIVRVPVFFTQIFG
jgi:acyl-CoA thioester hydrolase